MDDEYDWLDDGLDVSRVTGPQPVSADHLRQVLDDYFENLEAAIDHDRRFQLNATWGIVRGICSAAALGAAWFITNWLELNQWLEGIIGLAVFLGVLVWMTGNVEKDKAKDEGKLSRLPKWEEYSRRL